MKKSLHIAAGLSLLGMTALRSSSVDAFTSISIQTVSAQAVIGVSAVTPLSITAVPLTDQVFFEKNLVIGVDIRSTDHSAITTTGLKVDLVYQLIDAGGQALGGTISQPVLIQPDLSDAGHLLGTAFVPRADLEPIQRGGSVLYFFQALQGTSATVLSHAGAGAFPAPNGIAGLPQSDYFSASVIATQQATVYPTGSLVSLPDTYQFDGHTAVSLPAGAVSAPTGLSITQNDLSTLPPGPGGLSAIVAYTVQLDNGAQPQRPVQLTLSYPADLSGNVTGTNLSPNVLAPYWYNAGNWQLLSLPQLDSSLHTITGMTTRFSTFALFPVGRVGAENLRAPQRIITPNGDNINDSATFSFVDGDVKIFDIHGRRVRTVPGPSPSWDGRDDDGHIVETGVYLYQYSSQGTRVTGVIAVAK